MASFSSSVYSDTNIPMGGLVVRMYDRSTGALLGETTTDQFGVYTFNIVFTGEANIIVLDDDIDTLYNDVVHRVNLT